MPTDRRARTVPVHQVFFIQSPCDAQATIMLAEASGCASTVPPRQRRRIGGAKHALRLHGEVPGTGPGAGAVEMQCLQGSEAMGLRHGAKSGSGSPRADQIIARLRQPQFHASTARVGLQDARIAA